MKSFKGCCFKLSLPTCVTFDNIAEFKCKFIFNDYKVNTVFYKARLINIFNEISQVDLCVPLNMDKSSYPINFTIQEKKKVFLKKAILEMVFLHETGQKTVVSYVFNYDSKAFELSDVNESIMPDTEDVIFHKVMNQYTQPIDVPVPPIKTKGKVDNDDLSEALKPYLTALNDEKKFLMSEGGHKYKVTNGRYIGRVDNKYSYVFDLETELVLSDDAPIVLNIGTEKYSGLVMMCEDFQIVVVIGSFLGNSIGTAYIKVEPWKLLEALAERVQYGVEHNDKMIRKLFEGSKLATDQPIEKIAKGQDAAIKRALTEPVTIVWGPPGTGKTYTMAEIAIQYLADKKRVLIVSHSNVSVDGITKQIGKIFRDKNSEEVLHKGLILRYGYIRDEELRNDECLSSFAYAISKDKTAEAKLESLQKEQEKIKATSGISSPKLTAIHKQIKEIKAAIKKKEEEYVQNAYVVATTISKAVIDKIFQERLFDVVMFDEVSMAYVPQIMCAASFATGHMICVGDFMQLAPIVQSSAEKLGEDIFDFMGINVHGKTYYHPWLIMLDEQRRMYPAISKFSSINVYKNLLRDHPSVVEKTKDIVDKDMFSGKAINIMDMATTYCASSKNSDNSRYNILSGLLAFSIALKSEGNVKSASIITPYAAQTRLVRALTLDYGKYHETALRCATVHQFQGSESDVVIFDAVESYPGLKPGYLMGKDLNSIKRLINVAVTRARGKLVVVANKRFWTENYKEKNPNHTFYKLTDYLSKNGNVIQHMDDQSLEKTISVLSVKGGPQYYLDNSYLDGLLKDIGAAKGKILISLPSGELDPLVEKQIIDALIKAKNYGIKVLVKSNDYASLPEHWKKITWGTDNAIFPIIMIDDRIVWYGAPFANWKFTLKDKHYLGCPCKIACRVRGEHTAEIIRSLSDLDYRETAAGKSLLTEKDEKIPIGESDEVKTGGLIEYASHLKKCPVCGKYMVMSKGKSGKIILWCNSCKRTDLLTVDEVNKYIYMNKIKCPEHKCDIEAKLGIYGLYIRCNYDHSIKPENI